MSLHPELIGPVPEQTARVARAAFRRGNPYLKLRDELGSVDTDAAFADLFPPRGQAAAAPWRLALVTVPQVAEGLPDRQAAEAVRSRIDWKYVLGLELTDPGFDYSVLSEFRARLLAGSAEERLLDVLLERRPGAVARTPEPSRGRCDVRHRCHVRPAARGPAGWRVGTPGTSARLSRSRPSASGSH
jgi:transposase